MQKTVSILLVFIFMIQLVACARNTEPSFEFRDIEFSDSFRSVEEFDFYDKKISLLLKLSCDAYNLSDKKTLSSFAFEEDLKKLLDEIESQNNKQIQQDTESNGGYACLFRIAAIVAGFRSELSAKDLLVAVGNSESESWFEDFKARILKTYDSLES